MKQYEEQLQTLHETGMFYSGVKKIFRGNVDKATFFNDPALIVNTFGYYQNENGTWVVFVTDDERGIETERYRYDSEDIAISELIELADYYNFIHLRDTIKNDIELKKQIIIDYLVSEYNYSETKAEKAYSYLLQNKTIAFEFVYYIEHHQFVPDKYAAKYSGYTVKNLSDREDLTLLGAFNYMVYLKKNPSEALANLEKGLPKR